MEIKSEVVESILRRSWKDSNTKINKESLQIVVHLLKVMTDEALQRSIDVAKAEDVTHVDPDHLEIILPQFLLDL
jgi:hypothetical protein